MEDGARDKNELYSLITHLKIGRDQFISSFWTEDVIVQALQLADGPSATDTVLSLQLSQASHFSCSAHWALVNSLLRRLLHGFCQWFHG